MKKINLLKKSIIPVISIISVCILFSGCTLGKSTKTEKASEYKRESRSEKKKKKADNIEEDNKVEDKEEVKELKNTAVNDGNLVGNIICYARMVDNGVDYYFRNPEDQDRIYTVDMGRNVRRISENIFMKDMHIFDGYIYYANTYTGEQKNIDFTDRNIYRYSIATGENTRLTNLNFANGDDAWLSLNSLVDNYCYFSYSNGQDGIYHIAKVRIDGENLTELFTIPAGQNVGNPNLSVVDRRYLYFLTKEGLNCYDMETKQNSVVIPKFDCQNYIIYDGTLYYTEEDPYLRSSDLTGGNQKIVYDGSGIGFKVDSVQFNIYENTLYVLEKSYEEKKGSLKRMNIDGSNVFDIADNIKWFNIVNGNVFLRYWDGKISTDTELFTYNIAENTPIVNLVNFGIAKMKAEAAVPSVQETKTYKDDDYYMDKYSPVIAEWREVMSTGSLLDSPVYVDYISDIPDYTVKYSFVDLNNNGSKEMIVSEGEYIYAIYTLQNGTPITVETAFPRCSVHIIVGGSIYTETDIMGVHTRTIEELDENDNIVKTVDASHSEDGDTMKYFISNEEVSESDYYTLCMRYGIDMYYKDNLDKKYQGSRSF